MKLPGYKYGGVQSLGRENIHLPAEKQRARGRAMSMMADAVGGTANQMANDYMERRNKRELQQFDEEMATHGTTVSASFKDKYYYRPDEIPEDIDVERTYQTFDDDYNTITVNRDKIPGHEIKPALFRRQMKAKAEQLAARFTDQRLASDWLHGQNMLIEKKFSALTEIMVDEQRKVVQIERMESMQSAIKERRYDHARIHISRMEKSEAFKSKLTAKLDTIIETDTYDMAIAELDRPALEASLNFVLAEDADYYGSQGMLDPDQRRVYATALRSAIAKLDTQEKAVSDGQRELLRMRIMENIRQLASGQFVNPDVVSALIDEGYASKGLLAESTELGYQYQAYSIVAKNVASGQPPSATIAQLEEAQAVANRQGNDRQAHIYRMAADMARTQQALSEDNSIAYAEQWGGLPRSTLTLKNMGDIGPKRVELLHSGAVRHLMKPEEKDRLNYYLTKGSLQERMTAAQKVVKAFGPEARRAMDELGQRGLAAPIYAAGILFSEGQDREAEYVIRGLELAESDTGGKFLKGQAEDIDLFITEQTQYAFSADADKNAAMRQGISLIYRALVTDHGEMPGVLHEKLLDQASQMVLNNRVTEWKGTMVELPPNWSVDDWEHYWGHIPTDLFTTKYKPTKYNGTRIPKDIESGKIRPLHVGNGEYFLFNMDESPPRAISTKTDDGPEPLLFKPDMQDTLGLTDENNPYGVPLKDVIEHPHDPRKLPGLGEPVIQVGRRRQNAGQPPKF